MLIQKSELKEIWKSLGKRKLDELKQEIIAILKKQEEKDYKKAIEQFSKEEKKYKYLEKSISGEWIEKAGYGIGTVRIWKGKKYKKIAPGKWARLYEKEGRGTNIAVGKLIAKVKKIDDIEELMSFVMQNKQRFQDENGMDLPILDKIRAEVDRQSGKIESKGKSENTEKKDEKYTDNAKFVKEVKGDVWEEWNTDPSKFAVIYDKNTGKSKGLRMTQDIVDIINSVVEPSVLDWQDNVAEKVHEKYPEIKESYIKENIKPIRMGYRNGSQEKIQILNKESEPEKKEEKTKKNNILKILNNKKLIEDIDRRNRKLSSPGKETVPIKEQLRDISEKLDKTDNSELKAVFENFETDVSKYPSVGEFEDSLENKIRDFDLIYSRVNNKKSKKEITFNNHVIEIGPSNVNSDKLLITIDGKTVRNGMLKNREFDNDKDVLNYLKTKWSDEFSDYFEDFSSLSEAMKGNKNAYKGGPKEVAKYINGKTTKDSERKELLNEALNDRYGTDKKDPFYSIGDLYSKVKKLTPHSDKWYDAINNYDEASEIYRMVIGDNKLDYYDDEIEKERMKPNYKKEDLPKKEEKMNGKLPSGYVNDLSIEKQGELLKLLKEHFKKEGMSGMEIADALDNAMDSKISDLEEIYNKNKEVKELLMNTDSDSSSFKLSDIYDRNVHDEMKQVQSFDEAKNVIKQIADNYGPTEKGRKLLENFMSYNVGGSSPIYDKVYEHFGISYNDLDADFDAAKNKILKLASGQKNVSKEDKKIQQGKDDFASRYRAAIEQEDKNFQKKENSKNIQNQMTPKQQKTFDDFEKKAIKNAGNIDRGKRFAKHNYNIDGEDWTITTDGRVMLCSREKFEEPTKTDKITNMDKVFVINGQKESAIPDGIDAIIKAAPKKVVVGKDYNGKEKKEFSIIKLGDRYFNTDYLKTVQNFLGPLSNAKMQVIPGDNKSRVKFESGNKAVVLLPIENGAELENRIVNTNDIKKSLEDIIMFCNDFEDEDEVIEEINNESLFSDYSAENPELFNSIAFKVEEVLNECGICGL